MPCLPKQPDLSRLLRVLYSLCAGLCLLAGLLAVVPVHAAAQEGRISDVRFDASDDGVRMSGNVRFALSDAVQETLGKGVPVYFLFETATSRSRWYWSDKVVFSHKRHIRLLYQPLTRKWRVNVSAEPFNRGVVGLVYNHNYDTLDAALGMIQRISSWQVLESADWSGDGSYMVRARFRIDASQLQQPLRLGTVGQADWNLDIERTFRLTQQDVGKTSAPTTGN